MNNQDLYCERRKRIECSFQHKEPDRVPIMANVETWAMFYSGKKSMEVMGNPKAEFACFDKVFRDFWFDSTFISFLTHDVNIHQSLGGEQFFYSSDGVSIQYKDHSFMKETEYLDFIKDPLKYTMNVEFSRRFPKLNQPYPENYKSLKQAFDFYQSFIRKATMAEEYYKSSVGMPIMTQGTATMPVDYFHDYYRGMDKIMIDIRRRPEEIIEAAEALVPIVLNQITRGQSKVEPFPFVFFPLHLPTYISRKHFEKIYYPSFMKVLQGLNDAGGKALIALEGNWEHLYDFVNDIPKNFAACVVDDCDIIRAKKEIGDNVTLIGGLPTSLLRYGTKEECIDFAKKLIDDCAPGGGFMITTTRLLLAPNDVNVDNMRAVNEFIHEYCY
ncbi:MAG: uroporphyrinogen decarboxylase family protein [Eubacteriaceae bacterium]